MTYLRVTRSNDGKSLEPAETQELAYLSAVPKLDRIANRSVVDLS